MFHHFGHVEVKQHLMSGLCSGRKRKSYHLQMLIITESFLVSRKIFELANIQCFRNWIGMVPEIPKKEESPFLLKKNLNYRIYRISATICSFLQFEILYWGTRTLSLSWRRYQGSIVHTDAKPKRVQPYIQYSASAANKLKGMKDLRCRYNRSVPFGRGLTWRPLHRD